MSAAAFHARSRRQPARRGRWARAATLWLMGCGAMGCGEPGCEQRRASPTAVVTAPAAPASIVLEVDGTSREVLLSGDGQLLTTLVGASPPPARWQLVAAETADGRRLSLQHFGTAFVDHEARLSVDAEGRPQLSVFRRLDDDMPAHVRQALTRATHRLVGVTTVRVLTALPVPPTGANIRVLVGDEPHIVTQAQLMTLTLAEPRSRAEGAARGWPLKDVIGLVTPIAGVESVRLVDAEGREHELSGAALQSPQVAALGRLNRHQQLSVTVLDCPPESRPCGPPKRVRAVVEIRVVPKP